MGLNPRNFASTSCPTPYQRLGSISIRWLPAYMSIWHHILCFCMVASVLDGKIGFHGLISRHIGPNESSPPHRHQFMYSTKCLNGHNLGLDASSCSCTPNTGFFGVLGQFWPDFESKMRVLSTQSANPVLSTARQFVKTPNSNVWSGSTQVWKDHLTR